MNLQENADKVLVSLTEAEVRYIQRLIEFRTIAPPPNEETYVGIKMMIAMEKLEKMGK
jgi:hypothetical protein